MRRLIAVAVVAGAFALAGCATMPTSTTSQGTWEVFRWSETEKTWRPAAFVCVHGPSSETWLVANDTQFPLGKDQSRTWLWTWYDPDYDDTGEEMCGKYLPILGPSRSFDITGAEKSVEDAACPPPP